MRVLMIAPDLDKGGIGNVVMTLYRSLISNGVDCDLTFYDGNEPSDLIREEIEKNGSALWCLKNISSAGVIGYILQIKSLCKKKKYDVVHVHTSLLIWVAGIGARLGGVKKVVGHAHGAKFLNYSSRILFIAEPVGRLMNRAVCSAFVSCSDVSAQYTFGRKATFIPNYIPEKEIKKVSREQCDRVRKQLCFDDSAIIFGYIGCLDGIKKTDFIVDVISELRGTGVNAVAFLAGNTQREPYFAELIQNKGLQPYVKLLGFRDDCDVLTQALDYYISASESEGMSVSLVNAQMAGKPCIISSLLPKENDLGIGLTLRIDGYDAHKWATAIAAGINNGFAPKKRETALSEISGGEFSESIAINRLMEVYQ